MRGPRLARPRLRQVIGSGLVILVLLIHPPRACADTPSVPARQGPGASSGEPARTEVHSHPDRQRFVWPVRGSVTSRYGRRGAGWHRGVDIKAPPGTPIRAAAAGTVVFSGRQSSYGRMIGIAHPDGSKTVYAHNSANFVKAGDPVRAGTVIGAVGRTGRATTDHVHFEVRRQGVARDPLPLLQRPRPTPKPVPPHTARAPAPHRPAPGTSVAQAAAR